MMTTELELRERAHECAEAFGIANELWESAIDGEMRDWSIDQVREKLGEHLPEKLHQEIIDGIIADREHEQQTDPLDAVAAGLISLEHCADLMMGQEATKPDPSITCASCRCFKHNHPRLPQHWLATGDHGLCETHGRPPTVQHEESIKCGRYEQYNKRDEAMYVWFWWPKRPHKKGRMFK